VYILFESANGFGLFERVTSDEIGVRSREMQRSILELERFSKMVKFVAFAPFLSAEHALENVNAVSEGILPDYLKNFLETNLPKTTGKEPKFRLGVVDTKLGNVINEALKIRCVHTETILELIRGIRLHFARFVKGVSDDDLIKAQLGLSHSYSRSKVKFNVNRVDNMIIQAIALVDQLDKDINTFAMRVREWYSWHFPELLRIVSDVYQYVNVVKLVGDKNTLTEEKLPKIEEIIQSAEKTNEILVAARTSMGKRTKIRHQIIHC
jgi:nucleolar protein 56